MNQYYKSAKELAIATSIFKDVEFVCENRECECFFIPVPMVKRKSSTQNGTAANYIRVDEEGKAVWYNDADGKVSKVAARRKRLIRQCRYYHGEMQNPWECSNSRFNAAAWRSRFWYWESWWVRELTDSFRNINYRWVNDYKLSDFLKEKKIPRSLANFILNAHLGLIGQSSMYGLIGTEAFKLFFENHYLKLAPLKGHEATKYYLFYTGGDEQDNPFSNGSDNGLFWYLEWMYHTNFAINGKTFFDEEARESLCSYVIAMVQKWMPYDDAEEMNRKYLNGYDFSLIDNVY